jgi:hypothetical protein
MSDVSLSDASEISGLSNVTPDVDCAPCDSRITLASPVTSGSLISQAMLRELLQNPRATSSISFFAEDGTATPIGVALVDSAQPSRDQMSRETLLTSPGVPRDVMDSRESVGV